MSYDIYLAEPDSGKVIVFNEKHDITGGTYAIDIKLLDEFYGTNEAHLNITYNYSEYYYKCLNSEKGIRSLYGMTGEEAIPALEEAIKTLGTKTDKDYWKSTPGNAGSALQGLLTFAKLRPDGIFKGD